MSDLRIRQLPSGYWHIRGVGVCNWAQPPAWPCDPDVLERHFFGEAGDRFRDEVRRLNRASLDRAEAVRAFEDAFARLIEDGHTEEQARAIVSRFMQPRPGAEVDDDEFPLPGQEPPDPPDEGKL
jgi:hypothetical protein